MCLFQAHWFLNYLYRVPLPGAVVFIKTGPMGSCIGCFVPRVLMWEVVEPGGRWLNPSRWCCPPTWLRWFSSWAMGRSVGVSPVSLRGLPLHIFPLWWHLPSCDHVIMWSGASWKQWWSAIWMFSFQNWTKYISFLLEGPSLRCFAIAIENGCAGSCGGETNTDYSLSVGENYILFVCPFQLLVPQPINF